ncbi:MAG: hypothetical protein JXR63_13440 [Spirochaetales bacterium]|nr:hypothetical protein [Spirochaetales bacterium]
MKKILLYLFLPVFLFSTFSCKNYVDELVNKRAEEDRVYDAGIIPAEGLKDFIVEGDPIPSLNLQAPKYVEILGNGSNLENIEITAGRVEGAAYKFYLSVDGKTYIAINNSEQVGNQLTSQTLQRFFSDNSLESGREYLVVAKAFYIKDKKTYSSIYSPVAKLYALGVPQGVSATLLDHSDKVELKWKPSLGASYYKIEYREYSSSDSNAWIFLANEFTTSYNHSSRFGHGGSGKIGVTYEYRICAVKDENNISGWSRPALGEIRSPSAPSQISAATLKISKGLFGNKIYLEWAPVAGAVKYNIYYSFTENTEDFKLWTESPELNSYELKISELNVVESELSIAQIFEKTIYFRITGVNDFGFRGILTDFKPTDHSGFFLAGPAVAGYAAQSGSTYDNIVGWTKVRGAARYVVMKAPCLNTLTAEEVEANIEDSAWEFVQEEYFSNLVFVDKNVSEACVYKILAVNGFETTGSGKLDDSVKATFASISSSTDTYVGGIGYPSYVVVEPTLSPVPAVLSFRVGQNDANFENKVPIFVSLSDNSQYSTDFKLALAKNYLSISANKTAYYGEESYRDGVVCSKLLPDHNGAIDFKVNAPFRLNQYQIVVDANLLSGLNAENECVFVDEYYDFDKDGNKADIINIGYRFWDREAWKATIRKKSFNQRIAIASDYEVFVNWKGSADIATSRTYPLAEGYPALSYENFIFFVSFMREVAFNRAWEFQCPVWGWNHTVSALWSVRSTLISRRGEYNDKINSGVGTQFYASVSISPLGGNGYGRIVDYSDWKGFTISTRNLQGQVEDLKIGVALSQNGYITAWFQIESPYYNGHYRADNLEVYEFIYQRKKTGGKVIAYPEGRAPKEFSSDILNIYHDNDEYTHLYTNYNRRPYGDKGGNWGNKSTDQLGKNVSYGLIYE